MERRESEPAISLELAGPGATIVRVRGELDLATTDRFRAVLTQAANGDRAIVVDLRECSFIDSVSIGVMLAARRAPALAGTRPTPVAAVASGIVARSLQMVGADLASLPICSSVDGALEAVGAGGDRAPAA